MEGRNLTQKQTKKLAALACVTNVCSMQLRTCDPTPDKQFEDENERRMRASNREIKMLTFLSEYARTHAPTHARD